MAEKPNMQKAEMNINSSGSLRDGAKLGIGRFLGRDFVGMLKRGLRRARRRVSKKIIETEIKDTVPKAHHR
jgi:hypothetical protein